MAVARAQIWGVSKRMFSGISTPHAPPHFVSSPQITDDTDKFSFMDATDGRPPSPPFPFKLWLFYIKRSYLKGATQEEKMNFYIKTAAQIIGSEDEAKDRIRMITRDCSFDAFGLEICYNGAMKIARLESVDYVDNLYVDTVSFRTEERIRWSLVPKSREIEKGRFPIPKPDLDHTDSDYDSDSGSESDYD